ncbi:MAG: entericidin EcnA/B family protein [Proteobacteria bacterium]|nr:entericidin EcnA/B family protein [Pseudomonadota bacterium]NBX85972.1 entericidin EcnA/B family protein [Pseudomonadota bacterium]
MMKNLMILAVLLAGLGLAACETVKGAGTDLQRASEAVQRKL